MELVCIFLCRQECASQQTSNGAAFGFKSVCWKQKRAFEGSEKEQKPVCLKGGKERTNKGGLFCRNAPRVLVSPSQNAEMAHRTIRDSNDQRTLLTSVFQSYI